MNANRRHRLSVEPLEPRLVPSSAFTYTDLAGDRITVRSSIGDLAGKGTFRADAASETLVALDLTDPGFQGWDITTTIVRAPTGDGLVNIVNQRHHTRPRYRTVSGDLAGINCGDAGDDHGTENAASGLMGQFGPTQLGIGDRTVVNGRPAWPSGVVVGVIEVVGAHRATIKRIARGGPG